MAEAIMLNKSGGNLIYSDDIYYETDNIAGGLNITFPAAEKWYLEFYADPEEYAARFEEISSSGNYWMYYANAFYPPAANVLSGRNIGYNFNRLMCRPNTFTALTSSGNGTLTNSSAFITGGNLGGLIAKTHYHVRVWALE